MAGVTPRKGNQVFTPAKKTYPSPPTKVKINGTDATDEMITKEMDEVKVSAKIDDPTQGQDVKLWVEWTTNNWQTSQHSASEWGEQDRRASITIKNIQSNVLYKLRLWTHARTPNQPGDQISKQYTSASFWSNRSPSVSLVDPDENSEYLNNDTILFDWQFADPDEPDSPKQHNYHIRYKTDASDWTYLPAEPQGGPGGKETFRTFSASALAPNTYYYWTVRARDEGGLWSDWPNPNSFFIRGIQTPPELLDPVGGLGTARVVGYGSAVRFQWRFRDPDPTSRQQQADIRWRAVGAAGGAPADEGWVLHVGTGLIPGTTMQWDIDGGYFQPTFLYEWQMRTYDDKHGGLPSEWSESAYFVAAVNPGYANGGPPVLEESDPRNELGCGTHRVFIYDQGGMILRGEIKPLERVQWGRKRDDIANCIIDTNGFDQDCCELLGNLQSWMHEVVIFRGQERVFEGPITRITYTSENVQIEAKDVMAYLYRRVMRQGYNDRYRRIDLTPKTPTEPISTGRGGPYTVIGEVSVVDRALQIALNALAYYDPNVLPYLTAIRYLNDATQQREIPDWSKSAWEEIDDLAATAGLDYVTVGRRIMFWDTHRTIGRLPEMRDGDFSDPVIVTEYGMNLANYYVVTNNNGIAGSAYPRGHDGSNWNERYGPVEMVSSAYGEQEGAATDTDALTSDERQLLIESFNAQAQRGISHRWPVPVTVRVPDNSTINPKVNLGINQLVPGVWIPLRATLTCRKLAQWQKLDSLDVEEVAGQEYVRVTMSPAPNGGDDDPDSDAAAEAQG